MTDTNDPTDLADFSSRNEDQGATEKVPMLDLAWLLSLPKGRGVALTETGQAAFARAEEIFPLGQGIPAELREAASGKLDRLTVGLSDGISMLAAHALLEPALSAPQALAAAASILTRGIATVKVVPADAHQAPARRGTVLSFKQQLPQRLLKKL